MRMSMLFAHITTRFLMPLVNKGFVAWHWTTPSVVQHQIRLSKTSWWYV